MYLRFPHVPSHAMFYLSLILFSGCNVSHENVVSTALNGSNTNINHCCSSLNVNSTNSPPRSYSTIITTGISPKLPPVYAFPVSQQYKNGCFGFAVKHIFQYKYGENLDLYDVEKTIKKPRGDLWTVEHITNFKNTYHFDILSYNDAETLFALLEQGEPLIVQYKYKLSDGTWIGHMVAAYSFDSEGVWISESIQNTRTRVPYKEIFDSTGLFTQFVFSTIEKSI